MSLVVIEPQRKSVPSRRMRPLTGASALVMAVLLAWPSGYGRACCCSDDAPDSHGPGDQTLESGATHQSHAHGAHASLGHSRVHHGADGRRRARERGPQLNAPGTAECPPWVSPENGVCVTPESGPKLGAVSLASAFDGAAPDEAIPVSVGSGYQAHAPPGPPGPARYLVLERFLT